MSPLYRRALCVLLYLGLWGAGSVQAQSQGGRALDPAKALTQYHIEAWTIEDGLPQNSVHAIAQTPDGYLWASTQEGVARFDGVSFMTFDRRNVQALQSNDIISMIVDRRGVLWIGTNGGGLTRYEGGRFHTYTTEDGLVSNHVGALLEDRAGALWVGTRAGLSRLRDGQFTTFTVADGLPDNSIMSLQEDGQGGLWIGTGSGLGRYQGGRFTPQTNLAAHSIWMMARDQEDALWIGTDGGLLRYRDGAVVTYTTADGLPSNNVLSVRQDAAGTLWVGTDEGLARFQEGRFAVLSPADGLSDGVIWTIFADREGSLWLGTESGGLNQLKDLKFTTLTTREGLSSDQVWPIYEDRQGVLWIGTDRGLNRYEGGRFTVFTEQDGLSGSSVNTILEDGRGDLWVGTERGLNRLRNGVFTALTTRHGLPHDNVLALYEDREGTLWVGTAGGLSRYQDGRFTTYTTQHGLADELVFAIHQDRRGDLWFGTRSGLSRYRNGTFTTYTRRNGLSTDYILAITEDAEGTLWIATWGGGLNRFKEGRFSSFTVKEGLLSDNIFQILEDGQGHLWMSSNVGIFRVSKQALADVADGRAATVNATTFGKSDGLRSRECNGGTQPAGWRSRDGRMWFPTVAGVAMIDPAHIPVNDLPPPVVIQHVVADEEAVPLTGAIVLRPGQDKIEFHYAALTYLAPGRTVFQYRLDGVDEEWVEAQTRRTAYYTNLPPGTYRFEVRACNSDGVCNLEGAALSFRLRPHFYQTSWFYLLCLLSLGCAGFGLYRLRVRQLQARQKELEGLVEARTKDLREEKDKTETALQETEAARRDLQVQKEIVEQAKTVIEEQAQQLRALDEQKTRFFNNISHEFRTPLTLTIGPLENALSGVYGPVSEEMRKQVETMLRNARRLLRLINQLLDLAKLESDKMELRARYRSLSPFIEDIALSFSGFAEERGIALAFRSDVEDDRIYFDGEKLEKIIFNLLSNAFKFTPGGGRIDVAVEDRADAGLGDAVVILVRDTGPGVPKEDQPYIFDRFRQGSSPSSQVQAGTGIGLSLAKEMAELHGGTLRVESEPGEGATFFITLRRGDAHLQPAQICSAGEEGTLEAALSLTTELAAIGEPEPALAEGLLGEAQGDGVAASVPTLLVIDDNRDVRAYVKSCLAGRYRVEEARDGEEGLGRARLLRPDLILCDVMMPRMNGYELCRSVKEDPALNHIPVVLLTAKASVDMKVEGLARGADDYMTKPFNARELLARIENLLRLRRQEGELKVLNESLEQKVREQLELILAEREQYERTLVVAKEKAEESARLKTSILENMSHEIRTPITAILGFAQVLQDEVEQGQQEFIHYIEENGVRLMNTLNALLDLSRLEAEGMQLDRQPCDLAEVGGEMVRALAPLAEKKGLRLRVEPPERPAVAHLDRGALERIFSNLIGNAVKFTKEGEVVVTSGVRDDQVYFTVRDTGVGISPEFMPHLFEAFKQESEGLARGFEGTGIGLTVTRQLVEVMGGEISVESRKGDGTAFTVTFPGVTVPASTTLTV